MPRSATKKTSPPVQEGEEFEKKKFNLELQKLRLEEDKSWFEFHKHMTTLNTGVIIIVATLIEKVFTNIDPVSFQIIASAFYAFLGSITMSVIGLGYHMPSLRIVRSTNTISKGSLSLIYILRYPKAFLFIMSLLGFLLGISFFIGFALRNSQ